MTLAQSFGQPIAYSVGDYPYGSVLGDFNNDGKLDLAVANNLSKNVSVLLGNGDGTFAAKLDYDVGASAYALVITDFDGDGKLDIATANSFSNISNVSVLLGNGNGTFKPKADYALSEFALPNAIAFGDFNLDGKPDLVTANEGGNGGSVLINKGDGTFNNPVNYPAGPFATSVVVGDFNLDAKPDVAISNYGGNTGQVSVLIGNGDGTFQPMVTYPTGAGPFAIVSGYFNGDGNLDLITANIQVNTISVLLGNADGTFQTPVNYPAPFGQSLAAGDINSDGKQDLVMGVSIIMGNGDGSFRAPHTYQVSGYSTTVKDLNGDGKPELIIASGTGTVVSVLINQSGPFSISGTVRDGGSLPLGGATLILAGGTSQVLTAGADGAFAFSGLTAGGNFVLTPAKTNYSFAPPNQSFNNLSADASADFVGTLLEYSISGKVRDNFGNPITGVVMTLTGSASDTRTTASDGSYSFPTLPGGGNYTVTPSFPKFSFGPASAGFNNLSSNRVSNFQGRVATYTISGIVANSTNGSGIDGMTLVLTGTKTGTFVTNFQGYSFSGLPVDGNYTITAFASAPNRLFTQYVLVGSSSQVVNGLSANTTVNFTARYLSFDSSNGDPRGLAAGDLDGDGKRDLVVAAATGSKVHVLLGNGDGTFKPEVTYAVSSGAGDVAIADFNGDGKPDVASANFGGDVSVFIGNGDGTLKSQVIYPAGAQNYSLVVSDLNLDGKKDLAVFGSGNNVSILLGKGDGTFQAAVTKSLGSALGNVSVGDFNGDNKPDLVFPGFPNSLLFLQGNGDGTFADAVSYPAATDALKATVGDFNGDGKLDVAVANNAAYTILLGNGNGTFQNAVTHTLSSNTSNIANGDFDGDGKLDLAVANYFGGISFLAGNGDGTFAPAVGYPSGSYSIALVGTDFNNDGRLDVAVTNGGGTVVGVLLNTALTHVPLTEFSASGYAVNEEAFYADITVSRSGNSSGAIAVDYSTGDGTAKQSADYTNAFGTLNFAPGETSKTFTILVADNNYVDGNRTVLLNLSNPVGALINGSTSAVLTIADNDTIQPTTNPADDPQFFVRQHYSDFLNRVPDSGGFNFWTGFVTQCVNDPVCVRSRRIDVSNAFFYELEYQQTGAYVYRLYRAAFGNNQPFPNPFPDTNNPGEEKKVVAYQAFVQDRARVVGGANLAQAQLELANAFVLRTAFQSKYSVSLDGPGFVDAVLATIKNELGADLAAQRSALIALYNSGGRGAVMYRLADDNAQTNPVNNQLFINAEYNRAFVATQYFGYLRRDPDMGGFLFWLGQVSSAPLRDVTKQHAMVCSFVTSGEYQLRFSSVVTHSNSECQ